MPAISFSAVTAQGPTYLLIQDGRKKMTIRKPRKRPIKKGDTLYLYWKQRMPKDKKPIHLIGVAICTNVRRMRYLEFAYLNEIAIKDGFKDIWDMHKWFGSPHAHADQEYDLIEFELKEKGA